VTRPDAERAAGGRGRTVRAFIALPLPSDVLASLGDVQRALSRQTPHNTVRWVRPAGIHLTLKFLGETPLEQLGGIEAALGVVARNAPRFTFAVAGAGCFPNPRRPRVVWVGTTDPLGRLARLQAAIEEALGSIGIPPERRPFRPHLTVGRVNRRASRQDAARVGEAVARATVGELGQVTVTTVELIRSVLKPTGAEYTTLFRLPLRAV
jgi:2'-5' RNA ligase